MPKRKKEKINILETPDQTKVFLPKREVQSLLIKKMLAEIEVKSKPEHDFKPDVKTN